MGPAFGIIAVLGLLMVILHLTVGGLSRSNWAAADRTTLSIDNTSLAGVGQAFVFGLVAVFALSRILAMGGGQTGGFVIGLLVAVVALLQSALAGRLSPLIGLFYSLVGLVASVPALAELFDGDRCSTVISRPVVITVLVLLIAGWAGGTVLGWIFGSRLSRVGRILSKNSHAASAGLALFGAIDVIVLATGPIGAGSPDIAVLLFWLVAAFGFVAGIAPAPALFAAGAALAVLGFLELTVPNMPGCDSSVSAAPLSAVVGYCLVFWLVSWFRSRLGLRRARRSWGR